MNLSVVIPTRNRWEVLERVIASYISSPRVKEIILIDDGSECECPIQLSSIKKVKIIKNRIRLGALRSRLVGVSHASSTLVMFGEDDAFVSQTYIESLYQLNYKNDCLASGQIIYLQSKESIDEAKRRYYYWPKVKSIVDKKSLKIKHKERLREASQELFTHALFMTKRKFFDNLDVDSLGVFQLGNGYREETALQIELAIKNNLEIYVDPNALCFHLSRRDVPNGGQRVSLIKQFFYTVRNNIFFCLKYGGYFDANPVKISFLSTFILVRDTYIMPGIKKLYG